MTITLLPDFTAIHDPDVNQMIAKAICDLQQDILQITNSQYFSIYMGGGYGRGEGGVFIADDGRHLPYNDIDFFVFTRIKSSRKCRNFDDALRLISEKYTRQLSISIDFAPAKNIKKFRSEQHTLMYQELLYRHVLIHGMDLLDGMSCSPPHDLHVQEALRLLVNRGMGLLLTVRKLAENPTASDTMEFAVRNLHKAAQGAGDALLIGMRRYDYDLQRRLQIILYEAKTNPAFKNLAPMYKDAIDFKKRHGTSCLDPLESLPQYVHAWCEAARHFVAITTDRTPSILQTPAQLSECIYKHPNFKGRGPLINALRWTIKTKTISPLWLLPQNPTARIFASLCSNLFEIYEKYVNLNGSLEVIFNEKNNYESLIRFWRIFN